MSDGASPSGELDESEEEAGSPNTPQSQGAIPPGQLYQVYYTSVYLFNSRSVQRFK